jgi:hypothetical protein
MKRRVGIYLRVSTDGQTTEKRVLRLHKGGTGILKIGKTIGIGTGTVQRVAMEQPLPFEVDAAEAAFASR